MTTFFDVRYQGDLIRFPDLPHHLPNTIKRIRTFYEADLLEHLRLAVPRGGLWIDIGANIGNHTIYFSRYLADRVLSLEPNPDTYAVLNETIRENGLTNVTTLPVGASDEAREAHLGLPVGYESNPGAYMVREDGALTIQLQRLDDLVPAGQTVRLIKIDIQGHEPQALIGARHTLTRHRPHLVIEAETTADLSRIVALLPDGYRVVMQGGATPTYHLAPWTAFEMLTFRARRKWRHMTGTH